MGQGGIIPTLQVNVDVTGGNPQVLPTHSAVHTSSPHLSLLASLSRD